MRFSIISGSHQKGSQSLKVSKFLEKKLVRKENECEVIDLSENRLPMWDNSFWKDASKWEKTWKPIQENLAKAGGIIIVSPEYNGMATPQIKNFFLFATEKEFGHKPGLLVSVSAVRSGSYPISELRSSSYKNNQIVYLPEHLIIRNVHKVLNTIGELGKEDPYMEEDNYIKARIGYALEMLLIYGAAFEGIRKNKVLFNDRFSNGM